MDNRKSTCAVIAAILLVIGIIMFFVAFKSLDRFSYDNKYVGGDAYNYIIGGTYFSGYASIGSGFLICSALFSCAAIILPQPSENKKDNTFSAPTQPLNSQPEPKQQPQPVQTQSPNQTVSMSSLKWKCPNCGNTMSEKTICSRCSCPAEYIVQNLEEQKKTIMPQQNLSPLPPAQKWKCPDCFEIMNSKMKCPHCGCPAEFVQQTTD